ncbi:hypothetical protein [Jannaschia sp. 2305UL9-9]|uniref:hypothetical protein n=1 Tax=Jannaschia sp. 2305UL9-9 TaxID=3121638 RepID=UPI003527493B
MNRLDGDDKDFGYIVDYKDLFRNIESAVDDYTSEAFDAFDKEDVEGLITDRAEQADQDLRDARDVWLGLMDGVEQPKGDDEILLISPAPKALSTTLRQRGRRGGARRSTRSPAATPASTQTLQPSLKAQASTTWS